MSDKVLVDALRNIAIRERKYRYEEFNESSSDNWLSSGEIEDGLSMLNAEIDALLSAQPQASAAQSAPDEREAVARAICSACDETPEHKGDAQGNAYRWQDYLPAADAAIGAWQRAQSAPVVPEGWPLKAMRYSANKIYERVDAAAALYEAGESALGFMEDAAESALYLRNSLDAMLAAAPQPEQDENFSTTSDRYRAELYDEVWQKARDMGYGNVTEALLALERTKEAARQEQGDDCAHSEHVRPADGVCVECGEVVGKHGDEVRRLREALELARPYLINAQAAFGAGMHEEVSRRLKIIDAALSASAEGK